MAAKSTKPQPIRYDPTIIGDTGTRIYGGVVAEEFLKELAGTNAVRVYREMSENDPTCGAVLFAIKTLLRNAKYDVQAASDDQAGDDGKKFLEEVFDDMARPLSGVIDQACSMFTYGYAPMEIVWKRRVGPDELDPTKRSRFTDNMIGVRDIALRAQRTIQNWEIDPDDGSVLGFTQQPTNKPSAFIPFERMLLFRTTEENNSPEGRSVLRSAYRPWYFKKRIEEIEGIGVERDLAGLPIMLIPGDYFDVSADDKTKATLQKWQALVTSVKRDKSEGILLPSTRDEKGNLLFEFKLASTGGSRQLDTSKIVDRYNRSIATCVLADFIFLGQQAVGSFALSSDKTALFATAIGSFLQAIANVINLHLIPRLWKLNALPIEAMPTLVFGDIEQADLAVVSDYVSKLAAAGMPMFPDRDLSNHLRELAGLPLEPEEGIDMPTDAPGGSEDDPAGDPGAAGAAKPVKPAKPGKGKKRTPAK